MKAAKADVLETRYSGLAGTLHLKAVYELVGHRAQVLVEPGHGVFFGVPRNTLVSSCYSSGDTGERIAVASE